MKNIIKLLFLFFGALSLIVLFSLVLFAVCNKAWDSTRNPNEQYNTEWISDDKSITFFVDDEGTATGTMIFDKKVVNFQLCSWLSEVSIYTLDQDGNKYECEFWLCSYKSKKKFVATVEKTTFFKVGQKITFQQVE